MPMNFMQTADQLRVESRAFAAFANALAARFDPLGRVELSWRRRADTYGVTFQVNGLPARSAYVFDRQDLDDLELHFRQAEQLRRWARALR